MPDNNHLNDTNFIGQYGIRLAQMHIQAYIQQLMPRHSRRFVMCLVTIILLLTVSAINGQEEQDVIQITGTITNGTEGGSVPEGLMVSLRIIEPESLNEVEQFTTITLSDSSFEFTDIPHISNGVYTISTTYQDRDFLALFQIGENDLSKDVPLTIYETTNDPSTITIDSLITEISGVGELLEMRLEVLITNTSDRMFTTGKKLDDGRPIALEIPLPPASVLVSDSLGRFVFDEATFTVYDTRPLLPGVEQSIKLVYLVPYAQSAIIDYVLPYQLAGQVIVVINNEELSLISDQLPEMGEETTGIAAKAYASNFNRAAGEVVAFEIRGNIPQTVIEDAEFEEESSSRLMPVLIGGAIIILILLAGSAWLMRRSAGNPSTDSLIDGLTRQIQTLDVDHDAGRINHDVYRHKRAELEAQIQALLKGNNNP